MRTIQREGDKRIPAAFYIPRLRPQPLLPPSSSRAWHRQICSLFALVEDPIRAGPEVYIDDVFKTAKPDIRLRKIDIIGKHTRRYKRHLSCVCRRPWPLPGPKPAPYRPTYPTLESFKSCWCFLAPASLTLQSAQSQQKRRYTEADPYELRHCYPVFFFLMDSRV